MSTFMPRLPLAAPIAASLVLVLLATAGCSSAPPPTLYLLKAADLAAASDRRPAKAPPRLAVALGPVTVPDYLDRTEIVRRATDNRLALADNERWAEPLRAGLQRVLTADLAVGLGSGIWVTGGTDRSSPVDIEIPVAIEAFEPDASGQVALVATWEVRWSRTDHPGLRDRTRYQHAAAGAGTEAQAAAMSADVADLAADLAAAVARVAAERK